MDNNRRYPQRKRVKVSPVEVVDLTVRRSGRNKVYFVVIIKN